MTSLFHLAAACCFSTANPEFRARELEIIRTAAIELAQYTREGSGRRPHGRWDVKEKTQASAVKG